MTKFMHIVQIHPVENGEPNLHKVEFEKEFEFKRVADAFIRIYNKQAEFAEDNIRAVYTGCVNCETGELV